MTESLRIALCQINPTVADLSGNVAKIRAAVERAAAAGARVALFPELALCGFPPQDLLLRRDFLAAVAAAHEELVGALTGPCTAIVGLPLQVVDGRVLNAATVIRAGRCETIVAQVDLSASGPLDEPRYFAPAAADLPQVQPSGGPLRLGDVVAVLGFGAEVYTEAFLARARAQRPALVLDPFVSLFHRGVQREREQQAAAVAHSLDCPVVLVNGVGAQDEVILDGGSLVVAPDGSTLHRSERFSESIAVCDVALGGAGLAAAGPDGSASSGVDGAGDGALEPADPGSPGELWRALVLGIRDYVEKNGFSAVGLGLSGGVDSALVAALATDALGPERVHAVLMPSRYSSAGSVDDAQSLVANLGIEARMIPIEPAHRAFEEMLHDSFRGLAADLTEENLQARVRGTTLMALSNKFGWLILVTSNKSESSVGYSTLYGDSAGGFAPIQDVDKQTVYELCRWYNGHCAEAGSSALIPEEILTKAPSAELRPGQRDDQSLPPYMELDPLISAYLDRGEGTAELIAAGYDPAMVARIAGLIDRAEYKRRQSPPGLVVSPRPRGFRRQMPMTRGSF